MLNFLSSFETGVETESCLVVISDLMLCVVTYQILSKNEEILKQVGESSSY